MTFAGAPRLRGGGTNDAVFHELIRQSSTAFWEAYRQHRATAKTWLVNGGFAVSQVGIPQALGAVLQGMILFFVLGIGDVFTRYRLRIVSTPVATSTAAPRPTPT